MTWAEKAAEVYQREPCARTFREDLEAHLLNPAALVVSIPQVFALVRPVCRAWGRESIVNPWFGNSLTCAPDCWHIYLSAGEYPAIFTFPHEPLPWVSFERGNVLRFYRYETIRSRCLKIPPSPVPTSTPP
jgi:hypothetical protein